MKDKKNINELDKKYLTERNFLKNDVVKTLFVLVITLILLIVVVNI